LIPHTRSLLRQDAAPGVLEIPHDRPDELPLLILRDSLISRLAGLGDLAAGRAAGAEELARVASAQIDRNCEYQDADAASAYHRRSAHSAAVLNIRALPLISPTHKGVL
jgi:hypothetical protein